MSISASVVMELRKRTSAGLMDCKKALVETDGDLDKAVEFLRKSGLAKADKRSGKIVAEGVILLVLKTDKTAANLIEVNCETDFVARDQQFQAFNNSLIDVSSKNIEFNIEQLLAEKNADGITVEEARCALVAKIGENIQVRRIAQVSSDNPLGIYQHGESIAACVALDKNNPELAKDIAMHITASKPDAISQADLPADIIEKERAICVEQAKESGKPEAIIDKIVAGQLKKFVNARTLLGQPFIKDTDQTVGDLLQAAGAQVTAFIRLEVGEGVEKQEQDFAAEVQAQIEQSDKS